MAVGRVDLFLLRFSVLLSLASWNGARPDRDRSGKVRKSKNLLDGGDCRKIWESVSYGSGTGSWVA